jgi:hypothetical protein
MKITITDNEITIDGEHSSLLFVTNENLHSMFENKSENMKVNFNNMHITTSHIGEDEQVKSLEEWMKKNNPKQTFLNADGITVHNVDGTIERIKRD